jgi:uncharacterized membrane protein
MAGPGPVRLLGHPPQQPRLARTRAWPLPAALLTLAAVPVLAGSLRLVELAGGPDLIPADDRFAGLPLPLVVHIACALVFAVLGPFQLLPRLRRTHPGWHRAAGRVLVVTGLLVAASAVWMTLVYAPKPGTGLLLFVLRLLFGSALAACLILGVATVRRGDLAGHRAWMIRAYAIGIAAGTQAFTAGVGGALFGHGVLAGDLALGCAWFINLAVAEWVIRRRPRLARTGAR